MKLPDYPQPPYQGNAWEYQSFPNGIPDGWHPVFEDFAKRQVAFAEPRLMPPGWAYGVRIEEGAIVMTWKVRWYDHLR